MTIKTKETRQALIMTIEKKRFLKKLLPVGIILLGLILMVSLIKMRPSPKKTKPRSSGVLVELMTLERTDWSARVTGTASVKAAREISIIPQVSGQVKMTSRSFVEGGFFNKGQVLFRIDDTDYRLALKQAQAAESRAEYELEQIKSRADIARREWEIISGTPGAVNDKDASGNDSAPNPLVLYGPQMKNAQSSLESAAAAVELARLNLERTTVRAPFDCRVRQKSIDTGQYVRVGTQVALIADTNSAEVMIPLEREELGWLSIPGPGPVRKGSKAIVTLPGTDQERGWQGRVVRSVGEVDMKSRTVQVVVAVDDPYGLKKANMGRQPLLSGSFVNVSITGSRLEGVFSIPRATLRDNDTLWLMDEDSSLKIVRVNVARIEGDNIIIRDGIEEGDRLVLTRISGAADGLKLRDMNARAEAIANSPAPISNSAVDDKTPAAMEQPR